MCFSNSISSFFFIIVMLNLVAGNKTINCGNKIKLVNRPTPYSLACQDEETDDDLPAADARNFTFPDNSIFFIEATCEGGLDYRQACAVESAARVHPTRQINVLFAGQVPSYCTNRKPLKTLFKYKNIKLFRIHRKKFSEGTPLQSFIAKDTLDKTSRYPVHHSMDVLKLVTLYKFGGIYVDLDVITLRSLDSLPQSRNFVGKESVHSIGAGVIGLSKDGIGREFSEEAIEILEEDFNPMSWSSNGNGVLTKAYYQLCHNNTERCKELKVYDSTYFYPLESWEYRTYFRRNLINATNAYAVQIWDYIPKGQRVQYGSPYDKIAQIFCPRTQKLIRNEKKFKLTQVSRSKTNTLYGNILINEKETIKELRARKRMNIKDYAVPTKAELLTSLKLVFRRKVRRDDARRLGNRFLFFSNGTSRNARPDRRHLGTYSDVKIQF